MSSTRPKPPTDLARELITRALADERWLLVLVAYVEGRRAFPQPFTNRRPEGI